MYIIKYIDKCLPDYILNYIITVTHILYEIYHYIDTFLHKIFQTYIDPFT